MDYKQLIKQESIGRDFSWGIDIKIAAPCELSERIARVGYQASELLEAAIMREFYATNEEVKKKVELEKMKLLACFPPTLYVKEIPNGYCNQACCEHRPWYQVTTNNGIFIIGWRKRVISIDWMGSDIAATAQDLFPNEDVTKQGKSMHAWSYEKAQDYITKILNS